MTLTRLQVDGVRILRDMRLDPVDGINVIAGLNGAGKTSLLEAIHLLATGHSFRTRQLDPVLSRGADALLVSGTVGEGGYPVGIRKSAGGTEVRIRGRRAAGMAELARELPVLAIHPESHVLVAGPPGQRRAFMDWGAFHREADFHGIWVRYRKLLQQRNAALRSGADPRLLRAWDDELASAGERLHERRAAYVAALDNALTSLLAGWPEMAALAWEYRRGWAQGTTLRETLERQMARDVAGGFTHAGPHRAELVWRLDGGPAAEVASRGQQKSLVILLKLAQARVLQLETGRAPIVLVDDLASELDAARRERVLQLLRELGAQVFVTVIDAGSLDVSGWAQARMFHVEHGQVRVVS
ncbi:DNA replication/repair protein RecF [Thioalkalivibrio denitrificans]|uniref:DNA replication and repair protein RecF n=1 Tax=Thioalkalivibrio denitrificans TaxID=108003 RepID=A0A1V3NEF9_9GAMM|nr:DNA replication/repair protein RecF [Thioalkalivibrio denitrificans]OOG23489.1 DNA replication/repair protein RecF [Thioalkalivibrio denitrificans]